MSRAKHTPGPWTVSGVDGYNAIWSQNTHIATINTDHEPHTVVNDEANAARIVACVNACEGINPDAVTELIEALELIASIRDGFEAADIAQRAIAKATGGES